MRRLIAVTLVAYILPALFLTLTIPVTFVDMGILIVVDAKYA